MTKNKQQTFTARTFSNLSKRLQRKDKIKRYKILLFHLFKCLQWSNLCGCRKSMVRNCSCKAIARSYNCNNFIVRLQLFHLQVKCYLQLRIILLTYVKTNIQLFSIKRYVIFLLILHNCSNSNKFKFCWTTFREVALQQLLAETKFN